ncbi:hypothetical protein SAMN05192539_101594 [Paraburkholderia diazotrophica]|uniref:Uncharacterized protein n=1 Tax=Paraburkholderia diazotrophica TaxID=667676 RepID=A0A1H7AS68_9BURK|nr:hypothetical protein SAMN05192539_101594 [Paraburkholderia diazotrophica]
MRISPSGARRSKRSTPLCEDGRPPSHKGAHHAIDDVMGGVTGVAWRIGFFDSRTQRVTLSQAATLDLAFVEHLFRCDIRRAPIPVRIAAIGTHCNDGAGANVGAAPKEPGVAEGFEWRSQFINHRVDGLLDAPHP